MKKRLTAWTVVATLAAAATSCGKAEFEPPDRAEQVEEAEALYSVEAFDSVGWTDDVERARAGNEVYASKCRNCHGTLGAGGTAYALERGLDVPSLIEAEWAPAVSIDSVRHRIFVGHEEGMPTWGVAGITPREIDGAAFYVLRRLRPEILGN